jgi:hypothetical protein
MESTPTYPNSNSPITGYVYLIAGQQIGNKTEIKIGSSKDPHNRLKQIQTGYPYRLKLIHTITCYKRKPYYVEKRIQSWFWQHHLKGEWYQLSPEAIDWLQTLKEEKDFY